MTSRLPGTENGACRGRHGVCTLLVAVPYVFLLLFAVFRSRANGCCATTGGAQMVAAVHTRKHRTNARTHYSNEMYRRTWTTTAEHVSVICRSQHNPRLCERDMVIRSKKVSSACPLSRKAAVTLTSDDSVEWLQLVVGSCITRADTTTKEQQAIICSMHARAHTTPLPPS